MKVKMKLDSDAIKAFFLEHVEKIVMAAAIIILGLFILSVFKRETLPQNLQADQIASHASTASSTVNNNQPPANLEPSLNYVADVSVWQNGIPPKALAINNPIAIPAFPNLPKRSDPTLFAAEEVYVHPFRGALITNAQAPGAMPAPGPAPAPAPAAKPPAVPGRAGSHGAAPAVVPALIPGGINVVAGPQPIPAGVNLPGPQSSGYAEGRYGMVVTALVPDEKQRTEYENRFAHSLKAVPEGGPGGAPHGTGGRPGPAANQEADTPQYVWCRLERTDMSDGSVKVMELGDLKEVSTDYQDITNPKKRDSIVKAKLSPAFYNQTIADMTTWGTAIPEVADPNYVAAPWITWPLPPIVLHDWGRDGVHPKVPLAADAAAPNNPAAVAPGTANGVKSPTDSGFDTGSTTTPRGAPLQPPRDRTAGGDANGAPLNTAPYRMFRFVDWDVQPGHLYQYRVQLLLRNPNFGLDPQLLAKPDPNAPLYRETPWSAESSPAALPPDVRLIGGEVEWRKKAEPRVTNLGVLQWGDKSKLTGATDKRTVPLDLLLSRKETDLGDVLNFVGKEATLKDVMDAINHTVHDIEAEFMSQAALIDVRGNAEKLPGADKLLDASEVLMLTNVDDLDHPQQTRLVVLNEALDRTERMEWEANHKVPKMPEAGAGGGLLGLPGATTPSPVSPKTPTPNPFGTPRPINPRRPNR